MLPGFDGGSPHGDKTATVRAAIWRSTKMAESRLGCFVAEISAGMLNLRSGKPDQLPKGGIPQIVRRRTSFGLEDPDTDDPQVEPICTKTYHAAPP